MYHMVNDLVAKEGITKEKAYERVAGKMNLKVGGVRGQYQRVHQELGGGAKRAAKKAPIRKGTKVATKASATRGSTRTPAKATARKRTAAKAKISAPATPTRRRRARRSTSDSGPQSASEWVRYIESWATENAQLKRKIDAASARLASAAKQLA
jgi:hypothetical protein